MKIITNVFAKRHTEASHFSHFDGTWAELEKLVYDAYQQGAWKANLNNEGIFYVFPDTAKFYSSIVKLESGDTYLGKYVPRVDGEEPRRHEWAPGRKKIPATTVEIVLYKSSLLKKGGDPHDLPAEPGNWEIVSINAMLEDTLPIHPDALIRNHFGLSGGTSSDLTNDEFCALLLPSVLAWQDKVHCG